MRRAGETRLVLSCEHASNAVPARLRACFANAGSALAGHHGWDPGALSLARRLARRLRAPLFEGRVSRLVVDLNRSRRHPRLHSRWLAALPAEERRRIVARWWEPYRSAVERRVAAELRAGRRVLHVSVHSFTPRLRGRTRRCDVALLYDPARAAERRLAARWRDGLVAAGIRVRRNHPYRGTADGLTTALRTRFPARAYSGIELELNQRHVGTAREEELARALEASLAALLDGG